ncbi:MAG: ribose 5-phosphate isomerase B [Candidatus Auribacterota bacterium]|jgi:ribose 5-phosphate isomerase B|nr:ribose 5-phosphate isomerase B [Candidatus Auribacterota bacterium]
MKIAIGADHGGFELKEYLKRTLEKEKHEVIDVGCCSKESVDYPVFGNNVSKKVSDGECPRGILICTSGIGMSIVANRHPNIRAALCYNKDAAIMSRAHNNANILVLGSKYVTAEEAESIVSVWLETDFEGGRHQRRLSQILNNNC